MNLPLVTVVVPVYNVEKYLNRCVDSIVNQTYKNLEIILVDDASPDNCPQMCDSWAAKDNRIKVIHKCNQGRGYARNSGIDSATGEYICFVDSDDFIESVTIEDCCLLAKKQNADVVSFGYRQISADGIRRRERIPDTDKYLYEGREITEEYLPDAIGRNPATGRRHHISLSACFSLFSLKLLKENNLCFVSEREVISEDSFFMLKLLGKAKRLAVIDKVFYNYCYNEKSLTRIYRADRCEKISQFYFDCIKLCSNLGYSEIVTERLWELYFGNLMGHLKQLVASDQKPSYKRDEFKRIIEDDTLQKIFSDINYSKTEPSVRIIIFLMKHRLTALAWIMFEIRNLKG